MGCIRLGWIGLCWGQVRDKVSLVLVTLGCVKMETNNRTSSMWNEPMSQVLMHSVSF